LPEPSFVNRVEYILESIRVERDGRIQVLSDQRSDGVVSDLWIPSIRVDDNVGSIVDAMNDTDGCLKNRVRVCSDRHDWSEHHP
jgi:hypothetical protein